MPSTPETRLITEADLTGAMVDVVRDADLEAILSQLGDLRTDLDAQTDKPDVYWIDTPADTDQLPATFRPDWDVVFVRSETTTVPTVSAYRRAQLAGLADGVALPQALGSGDTALDVAPAGTNTVRVRNGSPSVEVGIAVQTTRWSPLGLTVDEWSFDYEIELDTAQNTFATIYQLSGVCTLTLSSASVITVNAWNGSAYVAVGTTSPALALGTLAAPKRYRVKGWKADAETLAHFRLYDPTGALVWDVTRDVGVAIPSAVIWGRTGAGTTGKYFWYRNRVHNVGAELVG